MPVLDGCIACFVVKGSCHSLLNNNCYQDILLHDLPAVIERRTLEEQSHQCSDKLFIHLQRWIDIYDVLDMLPSKQTTRTMNILETTHWCPLLNANGRRMSCLRLLRFRVALRACRVPSSLITGIEGLQTILCSHKPYTVRMPQIAYLLEKYQQDLSTSWWYHLLSRSPVYPRRRWRTYKIPSSAIR